MFEGIGRTTFGIEIIIGLIILAVGAAILAKHFNYLPEDLLEGIDLTLTAAIGCVIGGLFIIFKKLAEKRF